MDKSIVLNICGVKSLGGQVVVQSALNFIEKSNYKIILLHDNYLLDDLDINSNVQKIKTSLNRYFHPYLNIFLSKKDMSMINESEAIIHFGNFGFKTKNKSYALIQNLLPLKVKDLKNLILRYFINKSFKDSDHIIYQLDHVAEEIHNQFSNKLIKIGVIEKFANDINSETGVISIKSLIKNKNSSFMDAVLEKLKVDNPNLKITKFISEENQKKSTLLLEELPNHSIYLHTSHYETVGLPLYEASSAGLFVVAPDSTYMEHFDFSNSIKYIPGDIESATTCIKDALDAKKEPFYSLKYIEDWNPVLKSI
jgi:hypothetical protein